MASEVGKDPAFFKFGRWRGTAESWTRPPTGDWRKERARSLAMLLGTARETEQDRSGIAIWSRST